MECFYPVILGKNQDQIIVGCGKCFACRRQKARDWTIRCLHELETWRKALFITLTYEDNFLPQDELVDKGELQRFFKRFRKSLNGRKIKYFACGEYGEKNYRPHYHAIVFGVYYDDFNSIGVIGKRMRYEHPAWTKGYIDLGEVEYGSISYVVGYVQKKMISNLEVIDGKETFQLQSQGIGKQYLFENIEKFIKDKKCFIDAGEASLPRYYVKKIRELLTDSGRIEELDRFNAEIECIGEERRMDHYEKFNQAARTRGYMTSDEIFEYSKILREKRAKHAEHVGLMFKRGTL